MTLVFDLPLLDAPSRALDIWALDLHRARIEGLYENARLAMGLVDQGPTPPRSTGRLATIKTRSETPVKCRSWLKFIWLLLIRKWNLKGDNRE